MAKESGKAHVALYLQFIEKLFPETIEPAVCMGASARLSSVSFTKVTVGQQLLTVKGVKVYTKTFRLILQEIVSLIWGSKGAFVEQE